MKWLNPINPDDRISSLEVEATRLEKLADKVVKEKVLRERIQVAKTKIQQNRPPGIFAGLSKVKLTKGKVLIIFVGLVVVALLMSKAC